mgnify:CR=1 FL=1
MYTGNYECLELFVKPEAGKKRQCEPEEGKRKQNRNKRTAAYLWELDQVPSRELMEA